MKHAHTRRSLLRADCLRHARSAPTTSEPHADTPPTWKTDSYWRLAEPSHAPLAPDWWLAFDDPQLHALETQALAQNQTLAAASAHYAQAKATLANTAAQRLPEIDLSAQASRARISQQPAAH